MKTKFLTAYFVILGLLTSTAWASENYLPKQQSYGMGFEVSGIKYHEPSLGVKEDGVMGGLYGAYEFRPVWPVLNVLHMDGHMNYGQVDYKGSGKINHINDYMLEPRFWIGQDFNVLPQSRLTPYIGIGYRTLFDNVDGKISTTGASGYDRLSQYLYAPAGFQLSTDAVAGWKFGISAEYDIFIRGWQKSYLSTFSGFPDITNTQKSGYGVRGSIDIVKKGYRVNYVISPYIRYWNIKQSETAVATGRLFQVTGYEPANKSTEIGVRLGVEF